MAICGYFARTRLHVIIHEDCDGKRREREVEWEARGAGRRGARHVGTFFHGFVRIVDVNAALLRSQTSRLRERPISTPYSQRRLPFQLMTSAQPLTNNAPLEPP